MRLRWKRKNVEPERRWAQEPDSYKGPLKDIYEEAVRDLTRAQNRYDMAGKAARTQGRWASGGTVFSTLLAAAAGVTVIPHSIERPVAAVLAFMAAVGTGLLAGFTPGRRHDAATAIQARCEQMRAQLMALTRAIKAGDGKAGARHVFEQRLAAIQSMSDGVLEQTRTLEAAPVPAGEP